MPGVTRSRTLRTRGRYNPTSNCNLLVRYVRYSSAVPIVWELLAYEQQEILSVSCTSSFYAELHHDISMYMHCTSKDASVGRNLIVVLKYLIRDTQGGKTRGPMETIENTLYEKHVHYLGKCN